MRLRFGTGNAFHQFNHLVCHVASAAGARGGVTHAETATLLGKRKQQEIEESAPTGADVAPAATHADVQPAPTHAEHGASPNRC